MAICEGLREDLGTSVAAGRVGTFLKEWTELEARLVTAVRSYKTKRKVYSVREAIEILRRRKLLSPEIIETLQSLRYLRNNVVHRPDRADPHEVIRGTAEIQAVKRKIGKFDLSSTPA